MNSFRHFLAKMPPPSRGRLKQHSPRHEKRTNDASGSLVGAFATLAWCLNAPTRIEGAPSFNGQPDAVSNFARRGDHRSPENHGFIAPQRRTIFIKCRDRRPRLSETKEFLLCKWLHTNSRTKSKISFFSDSRGRLSLQGYGGIFSFNGQADNFSIFVRCTLSHLKLDTPPLSVTLRVPPLPKGEA